MESSSNICCIRLNAYNFHECKPVLLPCSHSFCKSCLQKCNKKLCPLCRQVWKIEIDKLPFIWQMANSLQEPNNQNKSGTVQHLCDDICAWCNDCERPSCLKCLRSHHIFCSYVSIKGKTDELSKKLQTSIASTEMRKCKMM